MDGYLHRTQTRRDLGALFEEDFDLPAQAPEPEVIEPVFSASELATERESAWREGHAAGIEETADSEAADTRQILASIANQLGAAHSAAVEFAEQSADAIARLLLESLAATFPALCANYGEAEIRALIAAVLPALTQEPAVTIRVNPGNAAALAVEIDRLDPDLATKMQVAPSDAVPHGDVRVLWHNGSAVRDASALWEQVVAILTPAGLLRPNAAMRETTYGE